MPLQVETLRIAGFRSIREQEIPLKRLSLLIGRNNAGKSNVLEALRLLFEGTAKQLGPTDFYGTEKARTTEFTIDATLSGVTEFLVLTDQKKHRPKIEKCMTEDRLRIRRVGSIDGEKLSLELEIFDPTEQRFVEPPTGIDAGIKPILPEVIHIEAFKDPAAELKGKATDTLGRLIRHIVAPITDSLKQQIDTAFRAVSLQLNCDPDAAPAEDRRLDALKGVEQLMEQNVADVFQESELLLRFALPEVTDILGKPAVLLKEHGNWTPPEGKGQGYQRMLYFAMLRSLAQVTRENQPVQRPFIMLVEEPEAFLYPALRRQVGDLLEVISATNQVVVATHSASVVTPRRLTSIVIVRKHIADDGLSETKCTVPQLDDNKEDDRQLASLLSLTSRAEYLFADRVLVVEGITDQQLLDACWSRRGDHQLPSTHLVVIGGVGKDACHAWRSFLQDLGIPARALCDIDFVWSEAAGSLLGGDAAYSEFRTLFQKRAAAANLFKEDKNGNQKIRDKSAGAKLLREQLATETEALRDRLRIDHGTWVLRDGEIEDYFGLSKSNKDENAQVAHELRAGARTLPAELVEVLRWATSG